MMTLASQSYRNLGVSPVVLQKVHLPQEFRVRGPAGELKDSGCRG